MNDTAPAPGSDEDLLAIRPATYDRVSGSALMLSGFFTALLGVQTYAVVRLVPWTILVIAIMLALGLG